VIARLNSQSWRLVMVLTLCVFLVSGVGHALSLGSCAETCFQAFGNRFLIQGVLLLLEAQGRVFLWRGYKPSLNL
jgi:hypothetical protein